MARYTGPVCRMCRAEQRKLMLKGARCSSDKCPLNKKRGAPGKDPKARAGKKSEYAIQLAEKQKLRRMYGLLEKQFHGYYEKAAKMKGKTGETMLSLLERRLDNVCYRLGLGASRAQARQIVNHTHILVNGKCVNIPSYQIKVGDVISVKETSAKSELFATVKDARVIVPKWLEFDSSKLTGKVVALPAREDIDLTIAEHLIIELYSK